MKLNNPRVLVIGGAGYIGSHVVLALCDKGFSVTVFDNLSTGYKINVDKRAFLIIGDILNENDMKKLFNHSFDVVFHFAALKAAGESMVKPNKYAEINICGTIAILNQMLKNNIKNIIFSSSAAVYGAPQYLPIDEKHPLNPVNFYGFTKLEIERILNWYSNLKGIKYSILRYFNAIGYDFKGRIIQPENNSANLLPIIMQVALNKKKSIKVFGNDYRTTDGTCVRDYIHVTDLSFAHIKAWNYLINQKKNIILNLASDLSFSVLEMINFSRKITKKQINYSVSSRRAGDPAILKANYRLAYDLINWKCKFSNIEDIIQSTWNVYKNK